MANFTSSQVGLFYPKGRDLITKVIPISRTDSSTVKCVIPKEAVIVGLHVYQNVNAATAAGAFNLGWAGATTSLINAFSMATTAVGLVNPGTATGSGVFTKLDQDRAIISTYTVGSSTAGGTGYVTIEYFLASGNEQVDD
jgi:hypothetical protein